MPVLRRAMFIFLSLLSSVADGQITCSDVIDAIDASDLNITEEECILSSFDPSRTITIHNQLGMIRPVRGDSFVALSTGDITLPPEPGTVISPQGGDTTGIVLPWRDLPTGPVTLTLWYRVLTAEYPETLETGDGDGIQLQVFATNTVSLIGQAPDFVNAASQASAEGTSFDLFTEDPAGTDTDFGQIGLPDAGLGEWTQFIAPVVAGELGIDFLVRASEVGTDPDPLRRDTVLLIDGLSFGGVEIIDLNNPQFFSDGTFTTDPEVLAQGGDHRRGAASDGVTRLLLRVITSEPGTVRYALQGISPEDGGLDIVGGNERLQEVFADTVTTTRGEVATAQYMVPNEFRSTAAHELLENRIVTVVATFTPDSGGSSIENTAALTLVRPPLVFAHGIWSRPSTWSLPIIDDMRFPIRHLIDYEDSNAEHFAQNQSLVRNNIAEALRQLRLKGLAGTQIDYMGHSMGGNLGRIWTTAPDYARDANFNTGDIRKLITLDSLHFGSALPSLAVTIRDMVDPKGFGIGALLANLFADMGLPVDRGALDDLSLFSDAILAMEESGAPSHALIGIGGSDELEQLPDPLGGIWEVVNFFANISADSVFQNLQHDMLVGRESQEGGISPASQSVFGGTDGLHSGSKALGIPGATGSVLYSDRIAELVDTPIDDSVFDRFPQPELPIDHHQIENEVEAIASSIRGVVRGAELTITSPTEGTIVEPGEIVIVTIEPSLGTTVDRVLVAGPDRAVSEDVSPLAVQFTIPEDRIGPYSLTALGRNDSDEFFTSNSVLLAIESPFVLESIELRPRSLALEVTATLQARVFGMFSDGIEREISDAAATEFLVVDPTVASVDSEGLVRGLEAGSTLLIVRHKSFQDSVGVSILATTPIFVDDFESGTTDSWSGVTP